MLRLREEVFEYGLFPLPPEPPSATVGPNEMRDNSAKIAGLRFGYPHLMRMTRKFFEGKRTSNLLSYRHWIKAATQLLKLDSFYAKL